MASRLTKRFTFVLWGNTFIKLIYAMLGLMITGKIVCNVFDIGSGTEGGEYILKVFGMGIVAFMAAGMLYGIIQLIHSQLKYDWRKWNGKS